MTSKPSNNQHDTTFNQLLGINKYGVIAGYFGSGAQGAPNNGYVLFPRYKQRNYFNESVRGSVQTQVTGLNDRGVTVGFWSDMNNNPGPNGQNTNDNFAVYSLDGRHFHNVNFVPQGGLSSPPVNQLLGVNDYDIAVGFAYDANGNSHGYTYNIRTHKFHEITIDGFGSVTATGINNRGEVSGFVTDTNGNEHGFLPGHNGS